MRRRVPLLIGTFLLIVGVLLLLYGYDYAICPIPTGSLTGGTCVVLDYAYVAPGMILISLGAIALVIGLFIPHFPRK